MPRFEIDRDYLLRVLVDLLNTPSPTGYTDWAVGLVQVELEALGIKSYITRKGALLANLEGLRDDAPRAVTAHVDTLGAMVKQIKPNGRLKVTALNGLVFPTVESEGVTVLTRSGRQIRGSMVLANGSVHVNKDARTMPRNEDTMEVRLDERTQSEHDTRLLGIEIGNFVSFDPRVEISDSGYVRSRFLDDKACVACLLAALKAMKDIGVSPAQRTTCLISNFEEVGHGGMDGLPIDLAEYLVMDMAALGDGLEGDEYHCSICVKDSSGPYSTVLTEKLRTIAEKAEIDLKADVYPYYGSDGSAYWRSGGSASVALIGPGVDTSHGYERTHMSALLDTALLCAEYLVED